MNCTIATVCAILIAGPVDPVPQIALSGGHCYADPDRLTIEDDGIGRAIVTYYNSGFGCSGGRNEIMTTPNGVTVRVIIDVNVDAAAAKERVTVIPQTDGMFAFPPQEEISDGDEVQIVVMGGLS